MKKELNSREASAAGTDFETNALSEAAMSESLEAMPRVMPEAAVAAQVAIGAEAEAEAANAEAKAEVKAAEAAIETTTGTAMETAIEAGQVSDHRKKAAFFDRPVKRIFGVKWTSLLLICYAASFLGWCVENLCRLIRWGWINSIHQILPFIIAYGMGIFVLFVFLGTPSEMRFLNKPLLAADRAHIKALRIVLYYSVLFVLILFGEMAVGLLFEKALGIKAWDYNSIPLHITQYTSIPTTFGFATGVTLLMRFAFPAAVKLFDKIPRKVAFWVTVIAGALLLIDWLIMIIYGMISGSFPQYWFINFR